MDSHSPAFLSAVGALQRGDPAGPPAMEALARAGDRDALAMVAEFRLTGLHGPSNHREALRLFAAAAKLGHVEAARAQAYLTSAGIGGKANRPLARNLLRKLGERGDRFSAVQLALLDRFDCVERAKAAVPRVILEDPYVAVFEGLFRAEECAYVRTVAQPWLQPAMIVDPRTGQPMLDPVRDSEGTQIPPVMEDLVIQQINAAIAQATGTGPRQSEPMAILRYAPGQQYHPHYDAYDAGDPRPQRRLTALLWLNDGFDGGGTHFPELDLTFRGGVGDLFVFGNLTPEGTRDDRTRHAGLPVISGEKWLATRWILDQDYLIDGARMAGS